MLHYARDAELLELADTFEAEGTAVVSVVSADGSKTDTDQGDARRLHPPPRETAGILGPHARDCL